MRIALAAALLLTATASFAGEIKTITAGSLAPGCGESDHCHYKMVEGNPGRALPAGLIEANPAEVTMIVVLSPVTTGESGWRIFGSWKAAITALAGG